MKLDFNKNYKNIPAIVNNDVVSVDVTPGYYRGTFTITVNGNILSDSLDHNEQLGFYFHQSDDGAEFYYTVHFLSDVENEVVKLELPEHTELTSSALKVIFDTIAPQIFDGRLDPSEQTFMKNVLTTSAGIWNSWNGDIEQTQRKIIKDIFSI